MSITTASTATLINAVQYTFILFSSLEKFFLLSFEKFTTDRKEDLNGKAGIDTEFLGGQYMLECQMCIRYVIVLAILHILIGIGLTNKLQNRRIEL